MKTKFTPGPWSMAESKNTLGDFVCNIHQSDGAEYTPHYSDVATTIAGEKESIQKANARLIACAPDMYKHIEDDIEILKRQAKQHVFGSHELRAINLRIETKQKLLKRARGE